MELAEQVVGLPFREVHGDTAGSGPRRFLFWRPPLRGDESANEHESMFAESAAVFAEALRVSLWETHFASLPARFGSLRRAGG